jgi:hypothetical protein
VRRAIVPALFVLGACASTPEPPPAPGPDPLPLRVALLPIDDVVLQPTRPELHAGMTHTDMTLALRPDVLRRALAERLGGIVVVAADPVADVPEALRGGYDLVVACRLAYGPDVWQRLAEDYRWIDAMGHRRGMSKKDRVYRVEARLDVGFHEASALEETGALDGERGLVLEAPLYFEELPTSLEDRSGGDLAAMLETILLVPALMELEGEELEERLCATMVPEALADSLAERLRHETSQLLGGPVAPFELDAGATRIVQGASGATVRGLVRLDPSSRVRRIREVRAEAGGVRRLGTLRETADGIAFEVDLPAAEPGGLVRLELVAGSRVLYRRGFTIRVPAVVAGS